ncbi:MAG: serine hydrolase domain-containing protein [Alphaproteobacteria bacterium]
MGDFLRNVAVLGLAGALAGTGPVRADDAALQAVLDDFLAEEALDGGVLLVGSDDGDAVVVSGLAELRGRTAVTPDTRFYVASVGKMVVATAILAYVADGALALDAPVLPYVDDIPGIARLDNVERVTVAQLLSHTSGLVDYLDDPFLDASYDEPERHWSAAEAIAFAYDQPAYAAPGATFEYCNTNYVILGHVLERLAGSLDAALQAKVFGPAGMTASTVGAPRGVPLARGYMDGEDVSAQSWASELGDGPMVTTAADLERFAFALFRDGRLLPPQLVAAMTAGTAAEPTYGYGMGIETDGWGAWYGHSGGYDGFEADLRYYPADGTVFVFLTNGNQLSEDAILDEAADAWFAE